MKRTFADNTQIHTSNIIRKRVITSVVIHKYITFLSLIIAMALCYSLLASYPSVIAQSSSNSSGSGSGSTNPQYQAGQGLLLEKVSDKGSYRVQIMWNQLTSQGGSAIPSAIPKQGFEMEIDFLNASAPLPTGKTVPQKESGIRSESSLGSSGTHIPSPSVIQPTVPVDSYDITIYSDHGQVLWKKLNQPATGGRGLERVIFPNSNYSGGITIQITNIKSGNIPPNAVTFTARVA